MRRHAVLAAFVVLAVVTAACAGPRLHHNAAENALGPYSGSVDSGGFVFASGKVGPDRTDFASEADSAIRAVEAELARSGLGLHDVVSVTVYLTDIELYSEFNEVYAVRFRVPYPARTCVAVSALPGGARVEVAAIARKR